jgi:toxin ParE1/3/4
VRYRLTLEADKDILRILKESKKLFGEAQARIYAGIIERGIAMIAEDPSGPVFANRDDVRPGVKSFHLEHVRNRRNSASHMIYFQKRSGPDGKDMVVIVGVLHERMLPKRKLGMTLRKLDSEEPDSGPTPGRK